MRTRLAAIAATALLTGCAANAPAPRTAETVAPATAPSTAVPTAAHEETCLSLQRIREAKVVDDRTIDFVLTGGQVLRNTLPHSCPSLGLEKAFTYSTSLSQLCSVDVITVINQGGGIRTGASCGLGKFVPYTPIPRAPN